MPEKTTVRRARRAKSQGKKPTTQAGEFVREEMHHVKEGKHGAKNRAQAVAIGLSKARRSGVKVPAKKGATSSRNKRKVAGAKSSKPPQRSPSRTKKPTRARRSTSTTGSRRAPTTRRASAKTGSAKSTTARKSTARKTTARKTTSRSRSKKS